MKRRAFIVAVGGAAAWPLAARGQQEQGRIYRIGGLNNLPPTAPKFRAPTVG